MPATLPELNGWISTSHIVDAFLLRRPQTLLHFLEKKSPTRFSVPSHIITQGSFGLKQITSTTTPTATKLATTSVTKNGVQLYGGPLGIGGFVVRTGLAPGELIGDGHGSGDGISSGGGVGGDWVGRAFCCMRAQSRGGDDKGTGESNGHFQVDGVGGRLWVEVKFARSDI